MAAKTPVSATTGGARARPYLGYRHEVFEFTDLDNTDTWAIPGGTANIVALAVEVTSSGAASAGVVNATTIGFVTSATDQTGLLHIWRKG